MRNFAKVYLIQVVILVFIGVVYYVSRSALLTIAVALVITFMFVRDTLFLRSKPLSFIEKDVNPDAYFTYLDTELSNRRKKHLSLYKAYGLIYIGKMEEAIIEFNKIDKDVKYRNSNLYRIYTIVRMHIYNHNNSFNELEELIYEVKKRRIGTPELQKSIDVYGLMLEGRVEEAVDLLMNLIPRLTSRLQIVEMEYHLAKCYITLDRIDDAKAVIEFMINKDFPVYYTDLFKELNEKLN